MKKFFYLFATAACAAALIWSCEPEDTSIHVTGVKLDKNRLELAEGESAQLTATVEPETATNKKVEWTSDNLNVAAVQDGKVIAIKEGTAIVTVKTIDGGKSESCVVTVKPAKMGVNEVKLSENSLSIKIGETGTLTATVSPEMAANTSLIWSCDGLLKLTPSEDGLSCGYEAVGIGDATITVTAADGSGCSDKCEVTIDFIHVEAINFASDNIVYQWNGVLYFSNDEVITIDILTYPDDATYGDNLFWFFQDNENYNRFKVRQIGKSFELTCLDPDYTTPYSIPFFSVGVEETLANGEVSLQQNHLNAMIYPPMKEYEYNMPQAVDLGLPSGLLWSSFNLGAGAPEEPGADFAFAETEPKAYFTPNNYKWYEEGELVKYNDEEGILDPEDDAAAVHLGNGWRIPTVAEMWELVDGCEWTWEDARNGYVVTGPNGKSIFIPMTFEPGTVDQSGIYSSANYGEKGHTRVFYFDGPGRNYQKAANGMDLDMGANIRPVKSK